MPRTTLWIQCLISDLKASSHNNAPLCVLIHYARKQCCNGINTIHINGSISKAICVILGRFLFTSCLVDPIGSKRKFPHSKKYLLLGRCHQYRCPHGKVPLYSCFGGNTAFSIFPHKSKNKSRGCITLGKKQTDSSTKLADVLNLIYSIQNRTN